MIFTGAVDELFNWKFGALPYRSLRFEWIHERTSSFQNAPLVAYPQKKDLLELLNITSYLFKQEKEAPTRLNIR